MKEQCRKKDSEKSINEQTKQRISEEGGQRGGILPVRSDEQL